MVPCHDYASSYGTVSWFLIFMEFVCIKDSSTLFHIESVYIYCKWVRTSIIIYEVILVFNMSITLSEKLVFMYWLIYIYIYIHIDNVEFVCHKDWSTLYIFIYINVRMYKPWYQFMFTYIKIWMMNKHCCLPCIIYL